MFALLACTVGQVPGSSDDRLAPLHAFEDSMRATTDFAVLPPAEHALGPDPVDVVTLGDGVFAGVLGGDDELVVVDSAGLELSRAPAPPTPTAITADAAGLIWAGGHESLELRGYARDAGELSLRATWLSGQVGSVADVAAGPDTTLYVADQLAGRVVAVDTATGASTELARCLGPRRLAAAADYLVVSCLLDRTVLVYRVTPDRSATRLARIDHDAPLDSVAAALAADGSLLVAMGGMEDRPLDRSGGGFGNLDSFAFLYRVGATGGAERRAAINLSAAGVVMPEAIDLTVAADGSATSRVAATGSDRRAVISWPADSAAPSITTATAPPGAAAVAYDRSGAGIAANPLLDAWVAVAPDRTTQTIAPIAGAAAVPAEVRLGEALYSTTLIAPWNGSDGIDSRFTCQSCHHDGYSDGRTHYTGRDDVYATTRSVRGLFNNRPHFSRALDRTMADMVDSEFRVVNAHSGRSSWFSIDTSVAPWLPLLGVDSTELGPVPLRRALMSFLMVYTHASNPAVGGRTTFSAEERRGAELFRDHCEGCHAARLQADDAETRVPFDQWEALVMSRRGPIVWGSDGYQKTGVVPYVHPLGSRVPSLRRLYRKHPYFTNGTAASLDEVLARVRRDPTTGTFRHEGDAAQPPALTADDQAALRAFLALL